MLGVNTSDIAITTVKNADYRCIIHNSKSEAINLLESAELENRGIHKKYCLNFQAMQNSFFHFFCLVYIKCLILWTSAGL